MLYYYFYLIKYSINIIEFQKLWSVVQAWYFERNGGQKVYKITG